MYEVENDYEPERSRPYIQPVYRAIHAGDDDEKIYTLISNIPGNQVDLHWRGVTLLCHALLHHHVGAVRLLLNRGVDITKLSQVYDPENQILRSETPLITAGRTGCVDGVSLLVNAKAHLDYKDFTTGKSAIHWACVNPESRQAAYHLAQLGADTNSRDHYLETAMAKVIRNKDCELVKGLLKYGVHLNNPVNYLGDSCLIYALLNGALEIADILVRAGCDVRVKDNNGQDSLLLTINMSMAEPDEVYDMCNLLLSAGARPDEKHLQAASERATPQLGDLINKYSTRPATLLEQSRYVIRELLLAHTRGLTFIPFIARLPGLPEPLKAYLKFEEELDVEEELK